MFEKIKQINSEYNISSNILLLLTIISVNFTSYLYYYDLNILSLIDTNTILKFTLGMVLPFVLLSGLVSIFLVIPKSILVTASKTMNMEENSAVIESFFNHFILKVSLTFILFSAFYIGIVYTCVLLLLIVIYFLIITILSKVLGIQFGITGMSKVGLFFNPLMSTKIVKNEIKNFNFFKLIISYIGVLLILGSICLGFFRAIHVENKPFVILKNINDEYSLVLTTSNGVILYENKKRNIIFKDWQNLDGMKLSNDNARSFNHIVSIRSDIDRDIEDIKKFYESISFEN